MCVSEVTPSPMKAFKDQVAKLVEVTQKAVESIQTMVARQNAFTQSIDAMSSAMKELLETTRLMNYQSLKVAPELQEENSTIVKNLEATTKACDAWFFAADFIPMRGGRSLDTEMAGILLQTQGLAELLERRWVYLVGAVGGGDD